MHFPVLLKEILELLDPEAGDIILDATLGGGGHAGKIAERIKPGGKLIGVDRDPEAIERAREYLNGFGAEMIYVNGNFRNIDEVLGSAGVKNIDGALFDLGFSSFQLDDGRRGFSFLTDGPLDMRLDPRQRLSAAEVVNKFGQAALEEIIRKFGEERYAKFLSRKICEVRGKKRIETTGELTDIICGAVGRKYSGQKLHPAARTFQALRIYVNDELGAVEEGLVKTIHRLNPSARVCVISFHSLEDRIAKNIFRNMAKEGVLKIITKKPVMPGTEEIKVNPRSRSAKLRVAEKII
ncbi:MAG: 16S rRNA (cytosine(1402)-N(4))-methyltransferase RsmH [Candidatus Omnitrophota bacterium]